MKSNIRRCIWLPIIFGAFGLFYCIINNQHTDHIYNPKFDSISEAALQFKHDLDVENILKRTANCSKYLHTLQDVIFPEKGQNFTQGPIFKENVSTRLAFSYLVHDNPGIFEILLHLTFRPHNSYCIYIDLKTEDEIKNAFSKIKDCYVELFPETNIFIISEENISWGTYSLLNADLTCLEALIKSKSNWDYYINLAGTELPIMDVDVFAKKLGTSKINYSIFTHFEPTLKNDRFKYSIQLIEQKELSDHRYLSSQKTMKLKAPVPYNMTVFKGNKCVILSKQFSKFVISHPISKKFREWTKDMAVPDESFFATLARITKISQDKNTGNYTVKQNLKNLGESRHYVKPGLCPRTLIWSYGDNKCKGKVIRDVCHLSQKDLEHIINRNTLKNQEQDCFVANKFNLEIDPTPVQTLAQILSPLVS